MRSRGSTQSSSFAARRHRREMKRFAQDRTWAATGNRRALRHVPALCPATASRPGGVDLNLLPAQGPKAVPSSLPLAFCCDHSITGLVVFVFLPSELTRYDGARGPVKQRSPGLWQPLVVPRHAPTRQDPEPARIIVEPVAPRLPFGLVRHFGAPTSLFFGSLAEPARVRAIVPDRLRKRRVVSRLLAREPVRAAAIVRAAWTCAPGPSPPVSTSRWCFLPKRRLVPWQARACPPTTVLSQPGVDRGRARVPV